MSNNSNSNKRIAKNTFFLYLRMFIILSVTLYTSRVVLSTLGIVDYGIYNVVGGVVTMFTFISMAMGNATARFITFALGKGDVDYQIKVFNTSVLVHAIIAVLVMLLAETVGLWFLTNKMVIPEERMIAAHWVYQLSIIAVMVSIMYSPFNSAIIAHEKMGAFAYISILDVTLKLLIVYLLVISPFDKLILYASLFLCVNFIDTTIYYTYCRKNFQETRLVFVRDMALIKEIGSFAGWSMIGNLASVGYTQGLNLLLNVFFGPAVNAARGVSVQVQNAAKTFVRNFQTAVNPQITKSYAQNDFQRVHILILSSTRLSFYLVFCIVLPIIFEAETILAVWLVEVPEHTITFLRLILIITLIDSFEGPVNTAMNSTGQIKKYQIVSCTILLMVIPLAYIFLRLGYAPECVFIVQLVIVVIAFFAELTILAPKIKLNLADYAKDVLPRIILVSFFSVLITFVVHRYISIYSWSFFVTIPTAIITVVLSAYFAGITKPEKEMVNNYICKLIRSKYYVEH